MNTPDTQAYGPTFTGSAPGYTCNTDPFASLRASASMEARRSFSEDDLYRILGNPARGVVLPRPQVGPAGPRGTLAKEIHAARCHLCEMTHDQISAFVREAAIA